MTSSADQATALLARMPLPLGVSLPPGDEHALSVSLPRWDDVVGYEEGRAEVLDAMACGYPRFFRHPRVLALETHLKATLPAFQQRQSSESNPEWGLMVMPTEATATRLAQFLSSEDSETPQLSISVHAVPGDVVWAVIFPVSLSPLANRCWQHTGEIVSSRHAVAAIAILEQLDASPDALASPLKMHDTSAHEAVRKRLADLCFGDANDTVVSADHTESVFLYPTGMAAIFAALRVLTRFDNSGKAILFGFPYLDSLKLMQRKRWCPNGVHFFPVGGDAELLEVERILQTEKVLAIFTEFPGNPLLSLVHLERLAALAHAYGTYLIVDDTLGSFNVNVMKKGTADIVISSLAKIFTGSCSAQAGSLVLNPESKCYMPFLEHLKESQDSYLLEQDASEVHAASLDLETRVAQVNASASRIAARLAAHPLVKDIFYPELNSHVDRFRQFLANDSNTENAGAAISDKRYGPLMSVVFKGGEPVASAFYDALHVAKGPSLGVNFTLVCPYTLLAHYGELDYVETCGVDRNLVRISVGLEPFELLWKIFQVALGAAESAASSL